MQLLSSHKYYVVWWLSCVWLFVTPWTAAMPGFPVLYHLPEFVQTHIHWVGDAIQPFCPLLSPFLPAFNLSQHQSLFQWVSSSHQFSSVQSLSRVWLFATPWIAARQASVSITNSQSSLRLTSIESVMPSSHLILSVPFSCFQSFPASGSFQMSQFFASGGQSIGVSA